MSEVRDGGARGCVVCSVACVCVCVCVRVCARGEGADYGGACVRTHVCNQKNWRLTFTRRSRESRRSAPYSPSAPFPAKQGPPPLMHLPGRLLPITNQPTTHTPTSPNPPKHIASHRILLCRGSCVRVRPNRCPPLQTPPLSFRPIIVPCHIVHEHVRVSERVSLRFLLEGPETWHRPTQ